MGDIVTKYAAFGNKAELKPKWDVHFALIFGATCLIHTWDMEAFRCGLLVPQM